MMATTRRPTKAEKAVAVTQVTNTLKGLKPIGSMIDAMFDLREEKRKLDTQVKELEAQYAILEDQLMKRMEEEQTDKGSGKKASASISVGVVADVQDWAAVEAYVKKTGAFQLFQRRISDPAFREILETKKSVPGITPFTKKRLNLRTSST
jgi:hypothetical protein